MNRYDVLNGAALICALALASSGVLYLTPHTVRATALPALEPDSIERLSLSDGTLAIKDAHDALVPLREYKQVVSLGIASDALLAGGGMSGNDFHIPVATCQANWLAYFDWDDDRYWYPRIMISK